MLITLVLWAAVSVPLALLAGRALRASRAQSVADEAEEYLRSRTPRSTLAWSGAFALAAGLTAGVVVVGNEAVAQLPAAHLAASRGLERLMGGTTATTTVAIAEAVTTTSDSPDNDGGENDGRTDEGRRDEDHVSTETEHRTQGDGEHATASAIEHEQAHEAGDGADLASEDHHAASDTSDAGDPGDDSSSPGPDASETDDPADDHSAESEREREQARRDGQGPTTTTVPPTTTTEPGTATGTTTTTTAPPMAR